MSDREKVVKGLQQHCEGSMFNRCGECPYYEVTNGPFQCRDALLMDVLDMLKEQDSLAKAVEQEHQVNEYLNKQLANQRGERRR